MKAPVLLICFWRPETTARVFEAIRAYRPEKLFIAQDVPAATVATPEQWDAWQNTNAICCDANVDWPCEVHWSFKMDCGQIDGAHRALNWFFQNAEAGIVLEDDCLPHPDFFTFCEELLERYRDDGRVSLISGTNWQNGHARNLSSYYFSNLFHFWGWASWRRVWQGTNFRMDSWLDFLRSGGMERVCRGRVMRWLLERETQRTHDGDFPSWGEHAIQLAAWDRGAFAAVPGVNLVTNIGHGPGALNCRDPRHPMANRPARGIPELTHPRFGRLVHPGTIQAHPQADAYEFWWERRALVGARVRRILNGEKKPPREITNRDLVYMGLAALGCVGLVLVVYYLSCR